MWPLERPPLPYTGRTSSSILSLPPTSPLPSFPSRVQTRPHHYTVRSISLIPSTLTGDETTILVFLRSITGHLFPLKVHLVVQHVVDSVEVPNTDTDGSTVSLLPRPTEVKSPTKTSDRLWVLRGDVRRRVTGFDSTLESSRSASGVLLVWFYLPPPYVSRRVTEPRFSPPEGITLSVCSLLRSH